MRTGVALATLATVLCTGLATKAAAPEQIRLTLRTLTGDTTQSRALVPKHGKTPSEAPFVVIPPKMKLPEDPKAGTDEVSTTTMNGQETYMSEDTTPGIENILKMLPTKNADASITVMVTFERKVQNKTARKLTAKARLRKGERLLLAPPGAALYALSADEYVAPKSVNIPIDTPISKPDKL